MRESQVIKLSTALASWERSQAGTPVSECHGLMASSSPTPAAQEVSSRPRQCDRKATRVGYMGVGRGPRGRDFGPRRLEVGPPVPWGIPTMPHWFSWDSRGLSTKPPQGQGLVWGDSPGLFTMPRCPQRTVSGLLGFVLGHLPAWTSPSLGLQHQGSLSFILRWPESGSVLVP